jgi:acyl-coenzyme A thioesterase PaaI-like protein
LTDQRRSALTAQPASSGQASLPDAAIRSWAISAAGSMHGGDSYRDLIGQLRLLLDRVAGAKPPEPTIGQLAAALGQWSGELSRFQVPEEDQVYARRNDLPGRGQCLVPSYDIYEQNRNALRATVTFGRYYLGGGGAVHGGAISLLFDAAFGSFSNSEGRMASRTAYLNVAFRELTPIDEPLDLVVRIHREDGRKRFLTGDLLRGETTCATAEALFIELSQDQS